MTKETSRKKPTENYIVHTTQYVVELNNNSLLPNDILKELLKTNLEKGEYEVIDNIITYSNNIEEQLQKYFENRIKNNHNLNELIKIQTNDCR